MNKLYQFLLLFLTMNYFMFSSVNAQTKKSESSDLVSLGYQALKINDLSLVQPMIMTESRYRQLMKETKFVTRDKSQEEPTDEQLKKLELEAQKTLDHSFSSINVILNQLGFNWDKAKLISTIVKKQRVKGEMETKWVKYTSGDSRTRLDIHYVIESENNFAMIKLNDVFKIDGKRYVARGYRFQAYVPSEIDAKKTQRPMAVYHLNTRIPKVD